MDGGTFTISNGGVFGSMFGTPIINPPQSAILGMHAIFQRPVAINGKVWWISTFLIESSYDDNRTRFVFKFSYSIYCNWRFDVNVHNVNSGLTAPSIYRFMIIFLFLVLFLYVLVSYIQQDINFNVNNFPYMK